MTEGSDADRARLSRIEAQLSSDDRLARLEANQAAIQASLSERRDAEREAAAAIQSKLEETAKAAVDALKSALESANVIELERVGRVNDRIASVERAAEVALATSDKAVTLNREDALRTELKQNEFRGALSDQANLMMPRKESEAQHTSLVSDLRSLRDEVGVVRQAVAVGDPVTRQLERGSARTAGRSEQGVASRADMMAVLSVLIALAVLVVLVIHG